MDCTALADPQALALLLGELEKATFSPWYDRAFVSYTPALHDPSRRILWIVPRDPNAGNNPERWVRVQSELFNQRLDNRVAHTNIVFAGANPPAVGRTRIEVQTIEGRGGHPRRVWREVRWLSAASHLWVDRLHVFDSQGNINSDVRTQRLRKWALQYWTPEDDKVYITPNFQPVHEDPDDPGVVAQHILRANQPARLDKGFVVIYGQGGIGKTFFLKRVADILGGAAAARASCSIPVFVPLHGILHQNALETWLAHHGFDALPLHQITCLLRHGVIVPLLDALDEVAKGEARKGSEEFLDHLFSLAGGRHTGRGILSCRDYYLTTDRSLVHERALKAGHAELTIGPFGEQDSRRFLQTRTGLSPVHAARWAEALDREARQAVGDEADLDVIRHPIVLDALARYIKDLPPGARIAAAASFRLAGGNVFGGIVDELLKREATKLGESWKGQFTGKLEPDWLEAFEHTRQRSVLCKLTLLIAQNGSAQSGTDPHAGELRHGLFLNDHGIPEADTPRQAFEALIPGLAGSPMVANTVPEEEQASIREAATRHLADAYLGHILASSLPDPPHHLIFALRHRFYFDYFLAEALLEEIQHSMASGRGLELVDWCFKYHVADVFASCLDFLAWDPSINQRMQEVRDSLGHESAHDSVLVSYLLSLMLAVFLRRSVPGREAVIERMQIGPAPLLRGRDITVELVRDFLPQEIGHFALHDCSFPSVVLDSFTLTDIEIQRCDFQILRITGKIGAQALRCRLEEVECDELQLDGHVTLSNSALDIECNITFGTEAHVSLYDCTMTERVYQQLVRAQEEGIDVKLSSPIVAEEKLQPASLTPGRQFVNRLMGLVRKHGKEQFGVFIFKLRDRTPGTDVQFAQAIDFLRERGCIIQQGNIVLMTPESASKMYLPHLLDRQGYDANNSYWLPIVEDLDAILAS